MGYNLIELLSKFNQFKQMFISSGQNPQKALEDEIKKRNITPSQLQDLMREAQSLKQLFGIK